LAPVSEGFPGIPANLDVAFVWGGNGKVYFFKDGQYWRFDPDRKPHVRPGSYPRDVAEWGLPSGLEAALQWDNGQTYFFKDGVYWRFNDRLFAVDRAKPPFPRNTGQWWFGCPRVSPLAGGAAAVELTADGIKGERRAAAAAALDSGRDAGNEDLDASSD
jgi:hypothetical protein